MDPAGLIWFDLRGVQDHAAVKAVGEHLRLHPLAIADIVNVGQRPKLESYEEDEMFIVLRMALQEPATSVAEGEDAAVTQERAAGSAYDPETPAQPKSEGGNGELVTSGAWRWQQYALFIGEGFVATFQETMGDCLGDVRRRLRRNAFAQLKVTSAGGLAAVILDALVDNYFPLLEHLSDQLESIEDRVVDRPKRDVLTHIYQIKRDLLTFRRAAWPLRDVLRDLSREVHPLVPDAVKPFVRDTADHAVQVVDVLESYRELAASFIEVYLSSISHQTNEVMRVLTIIATIFIPLTFLAGVYGMNFDVLPERQWRYGYVMFWAVSLAIAGAMMVGFWRLGWLGHSRRRKGS